MNKQNLLEKNYSKFSKLLNKKDFLTSKILSTHQKLLILHHYESKRKAFPYYGGMY